MQKLIAIILFVAFQFQGLAQSDFKPDLSGFSKSTLQKARANNQVSFMTSAEKEVVFYMNLVRLEPQVFLEKIARPYVTKYYSSNNSYVKSLLVDLKKAHAVVPLEMKNDLYKTSYSHCTDIGDNGIVGHTGSKYNTFSKRFRPLLKKYNGVAENIGFGYESPFENVMELLIDLRVKSLGHRKTILSNRFNCCAVSIGDHASYSSCCVIDYGILE